MAFDPAVAACAAELPDFGSGTVAAEPRPRFPSAQRRPAAFVAILHRRYSPIAAPIAAQREAARSMQRDRAATGRDRCEVALGRGAARVHRRLAADARRIARLDRRHVFPCATAGSASSGATRTQRGRRRTGYSEHPLTFLHSRCEAHDLRCARHSLLCLLLLSTHLARAAEPPEAGGLPSTRPERVGMSAERLARVGQAMQHYIDAREVAGTVTLIARKGKVVHFEARGFMDAENQIPMRADAIFRIASMSKPITSVALMM